MYSPTRVQAWTSMLWSIHLKCKSSKDTRFPKVCFQSQVKYSMHCHGPQEMISKPALTAYSVQREINLAEYELTLALIRDDLLEAFNWKLLLFSPSLRTFSCLLPSWLFSSIPRYCWRCLSHLEPRAFTFTSFKWYTTERQSEFYQFHKTYSQLRFFLCSIQSTYCCCRGSDAYCSLIFTHTFR